MRLSAPIFRLKKTARQIARENSIPLNQALNRIAKEEGFDSWSLLAAHYNQRQTNRQVLSQLEAGDLVLLAARPFQGKTTLGLSLLARASREGRFGAYFTLYHTEEEVKERLEELGQDHSSADLLIDASNEISSSHIIERLSDYPSAGVIVIDYLQLLDQRRETPELSVQVDMLGAFAREEGHIIVLISQIDRAYDGSAKPMPDLADVYLPNPVNLGAFTKTCFINDGVIDVQAV